MEVHKPDEVSNVDIGEDEFVLINKVEEDEEVPKNKEADIPLESMTLEEVETLVHKLEKDFSGWTVLRRETIFGLRAIADYIDTISTNSSRLKALGSGTGHPFQR